MRFLLSLYSALLPVNVAYMYQQVEDDVDKFFGWLGWLGRKNRSIGSVQHRKTLDTTVKVRAVIAVTYMTMAAWIAGAIAFMMADFLPIGVAMIVLTPLIAITAMTILLWLGNRFVVRPIQNRKIAESRSVFHSTKAKKIAVAGSYGKTSMKEMLQTILSSQLNVVYSPGNKNVLVSHAQLADKVTDETDIVLLELGEAAPGDIDELGEYLRPDISIVTGLAPNHLDKYPDVAAIAADFKTLLGHTKDSVLFAGESSLLVEHLSADEDQYTAKKVLGWTIQKVEVAITGTSFVMKKQKKQMKIHVALLGRHQVAPVALACAIANQLGMTTKQIESACGLIRQYEHRMHVRQLHGAHIIDDTYNGSIEGMKAGLALLAELPAKRRWYVTPGLVDQGIDTEAVHRQLGAAIADAQPDIVVLMQNSVTDIISTAMDKNGFKGDLQIMDDPLEFYTGLENYLVAGDVVVMQNDWTDNYN